MYRKFLILRKIVELHAVIHLSTNIKRRKDEDSNEENPLPLHATAEA